MNDVDRPLHMRELPRGTTPRFVSGAPAADSCGFSRAPLGATPLRGPFPRKKAWDYWCVIDERGALAVVVADVDYLGLVALSYYDFAAREVTERARATPLGVGLRLPDAHDAPTSHELAGLSLSVAHATDGTRLCGRARSPLAPPMHVDAWIAPPEETLNLVVPMGRGAFQLNAKHAARRALADVAIGDRVITMRDGAFAARDWGRGVWPYATRWNWACAAGEVDGEPLGLNLGGAWTDGTGVTENALTARGVVHPISDDLSWRYDRGDFSKPWRIYDARGKVDVTVTPIWPIERRANALALRTELNLVWARFSGSVEADDGARASFDGLLGWAEEHIARW